MTPAVCPLSYRFCSLIRPRVTVIVLSERARRPVTQGYLAVLECLPGDPQADNHEIFVGVEAMRVLHHIDDVWQMCERASTYNYSPTDAVTDLQCR